MLFRFRLFVLSLFVLAVANTSYAEERGIGDDKIEKNDIKLTLLSLGSGSTRITYERAFSSLNSAELTYGFIGMGWDWLNHCRSKGSLIKAAIKWRLIPQHSSDSWLAGFYVKPEFVYAHFLYGSHASSRTGSSGNPEETLQMALLAECGYQLLHNWFVFDIYAGLGPSFGSGNINNYYHSFMLFPSDGRMAFTSGFRIGVAF